MAFHKLVAKVNKMKNQRPDSRSRLLVSGAILLLFLGKYTSLANWGG